MLVLSRRKGEEIIIGDNIHVTVLSVQGDRVRLGINAPRSIAVLRQEVLGRDGPVHVESDRPCFTPSAL